MRRTMIGIAAGLVLLCAIGLTIDPGKALLFSGGSSGAVCWAPGANGGWTLPCTSTGTGTCTTTGTKDVTHGSDGTYTGTCIYYVSQSGNDANNCAAPPPVDPNFATPCKTIGATSVMLRPGFPDWLLLKKGDTWTVADTGDGVNVDYFVQRSGFLCRQGRSATEPMFISAYGTGARPLLQFSNVSGGQSVIADTSLAGSVCGISNLAVIGIEFYNYRADPNNAAYNSTAVSPGEQWMFASPNTADRRPFLLLEDNKVRFMSANLNNFQSLNLIRNVLTDSYGIGIFSGNDLVNDGNNQVYAEGNFFNHNGWTENATVLASWPSLVRNTFNHNTYFQFSETISQVEIWKNNISFNASDSGLRSRQGGLLDNNLLVGNVTAIDYGEGNTTRTGGVPAPPISPGTNALTRNVVMKMQSVSGSNCIAGITIAGIAETATATGNVVAHADTGITACTGITLGTDSLGVTVSGNTICDMPGTGYNVNDAGSGNTVSGNTTQASCTGTGPDPTRTVERYDSEVLGGPGTLADFIAQASNQSKDTWNPALTAPTVNAWIRPGYGLAP